MLYAPSFLPVGVIRSSIGKCLLIVPREVVIYHELHYDDREYGYEGGDDNCEPEVGIEKQSEHCLIERKWEG